MILCLVLLLMAAPGLQAASSQQTKKPPEPETMKSEATVGAKLLQVQRIYVESFGDDPTSRQVQAMIVNALASSKKFVITENKEKSDACLKGTIGQLVSQEARSSSESTGVKGASVSESSHLTETINDVSVAVRLVASDGDVIWAATKESKGAKYKGPSVDVADQVVKQLLSDFAKLQAQAKEKESQK